MPVAWAITLSAHHGVTDPFIQCDYAPDGDGTLPFLGLRSVGLTSVSASSISRLGLCLDLGNGAGSSAASGDCPLGAGSAAGSALGARDQHRRQGFQATPARNRCVYCVPRRTDLHYCVYPPRFILLLRRQHFRNPSFNSGAASQAQRGAVSRKN